MVPALMCLPDIGACGPHGPSHLAYLSYESYSFSLDDLNKKVLIFVTMNLSGKLMALSHYRIFKPPSLPFKIEQNSNTYCSYLT